MVAEQTEGVEANALSPDEKVKNTVDFVFQRKKE